jgi:hypothetical protein
VVQFFFAYGVLALAAAAVGGVAFLAERQLLRRESSLWAAPVPVLLVGLVYGILRFTGCLLYAADGWDTGGPWNYTWQNRGALILFVCGSLLAGTLLAVWKERRSGKNG